MKLFNISNIDELINNHEWHWCTSLIILAKHFETKNETEEGLKNYINTVKFIRKEQH